MVLATTAMLAALLGVEEGTIGKWRTRYPDFPEPKLKGVVYDVAAVKAWAEGRGLPKRAAK